jgi:hypothetical protein
MAGDQLVRPGLTVREARATSAFAGSGAALRALRQQKRNRADHGDHHQDEIAGVRDLSPLDMSPRR